MSEASCGVLVGPYNAVIDEAFDINTSNVVVYVDNNGGDTSNAAETDSKRIPESSNDEMYQLFSPRSAITCVVVWSAESSRVLILE